MDEANPPADTGKPPARRLIDRLKAALGQARRQGRARIADDLELMCEAVVDDERRLGRQRRKGDRLARWSLAPDRERGEARSSAKR